MQILLSPIDDNKTCQEKPRNICRSCTFVVDVRNLKNQDLKKDEFGIWNYSGSHPHTFHVSEEPGGSVAIEKAATGATGPNVVLLRRLHCTHSSNPDVKQLICFLSGKFYLLYINLEFMHACGLSYRHDCMRWPRACTTSMHALQTHINGHGVILVLFPSAVWLTSLYQ